MEVDPHLVTLYIAAFLTGVIDAMVGGGGLIQLPALFAVYPNAPPIQLLGTNKLSGMMGTASALARFARQIDIAWRPLLSLSALAFAAGFSGAFAATYTPPDVFRPLIPVLLVCVLVYLLRVKTFGSDHSPKGFSGRHHKMGVLLVALLGFYDGFFGPGTGSFLMFMFVRIYGFDLLNAAASTRLLNVSTNAAATLWFSTQGAVMWKLGIGMAICMMIGAQVGARLALKGGTAFVRKIFILVVSALILRTAWTAVMP